jgi:rhodanese-related sulfurtransferase
MRKNSLVQTVVLIGAALVLAIVANGFASRQRKLMLPGFYPNALRVPQPVAPTPLAPRSAATPVAAAPTTSAAPVPAPAATTAIATPPATSTTPQAPPPATATTPAPAPAVAATPAPPAADPLARFQPHPSEAFVEISGADAALLHSKGALFLDARRTSVYEEGHIAGARSFSVWESDVDEKVNKLFEERSDPRDQDRPIVIYCSGGACEDSHMLAQKLWGIQFNNLYVYKDGFPDWQSRRGAVRTGGQP